MIPKFDAASLGHCKGNDCNEVYCNTRVPPRDTNATAKIPMETTKSGESGTGGDASNGNATTGVASYGNVTTNIVQKTTTQNATTSGGTNTIIKPGEAINLNSAALFQILILTFIMLNSSA